MMNSASRLGLLAAATLVCGTFAKTAEAGVRVRFGGRIHVGGSVRIGTPMPRSYVSGYMFWGPRYVAPAPVYYAAPVPAYYTNPGYTPYYASAPATPAANPVTPALSRFGIGVYAGGLAASNETEGDDAGLLARVRVTDHLLIEGEMGRTSLADGARIDRRGSLGLVLELAPRSAWSAYGVAAAGAQRTEVGTNWQGDLQFGEAGVGLRWALSPSVSFLADLRYGERDLVNQTTQVSSPVERRVAPAQQDTAEQYSRIRLAAMVTF